MLTTTLKRAHNLKEWFENLHKERFFLCLLVVERSDFFAGLRRNLNWTRELRWWKNCGSSSRVHTPFNIPVISWWLWFPYVATLARYNRKWARNKTFFSLFFYTYTRHHYFFVDAGTAALYFFFSPSRFPMVVSQISPYSVDLTYRQPVSIPCSQRYRHCNVETDAERQYRVVSFPVS
jgi:hypothetical protein